MNLLEGIRSSSIAFGESAVGLGSLGTEPLEGPESGLLLPLRNSERAEMAPAVVATRRECQDVSAWVVPNSLSRAKTYKTRWLDSGHSWDPRGGMIAFHCLSRQGGKGTSREKGQDRKACCLDDRALEPQLARISRDSARASS